MRFDNTCQTMIEMLRRQAAEEPGRTAYVYLDDRDGVTEITVGELDRRARCIAGRLQLELSPGDRALLVYPSGLEFIAAFFGCMYAGVIAVPATYPKPKRPMPRLQRIALDCDAHVALSTAQTLTTLDPDLLSADAATSQWIATDELADDLAAMWIEPTIDKHDLAFLQYTSGSTSDPKGVMVSHANLLNNLECIRQSFGLGTDADGPDPTGVIWLPAYHDMGLIGGILTPLYTGGRCVLMSPTSFLQRPIRWLQAMHDYKAVASGAPNFAYELCARRIPEEERAKLNLERWRLAFCGAEPIRAETLAHFAEAFGPAGFKYRSFYPCYGLAESTLLVAGPDCNEKPHILPVNRAELARHRVAPACGEPDAMIQRLVGCGAAMPDHSIVIVDDEGKPLPEGEVGEILVRGPSVTQGYWNRPEETEAMFGAQIPGHEGHFLRTGDLGFFRSGELFITGRVKDVIIIRGRNHYPQDIEQSAEEAHKAVLPGAAFALQDEGRGERLVLVHQIDRQFRGADHHQVTQAIRRAIVEQHDLDPYAIVLIRQTSLPITSSGKVQRNLCREKYLADELKIVHSWINPAQRSMGSVDRFNLKIHCEGVSMQRPTQPATGAPSISTNGAPANGSSAAAKPTRRGPVSPIEVDRAAEQIEEWLLKWLVNRLSMDPADIGRDRPFAEFGVDSLTAVELSQELEDEFKVPLPAIVAWNYPTPAALARYLAEQSLGVGEPAAHLPPAAATNGAPLPLPPNEAELAALLAEIENLSDGEAAKLLAEEAEK